MIPIAGPWITEKEISYVTDAVTNGWYEQANSYIDRFEEAFKGYLGRRYAISLPSCTSGLHLSLLALGVGPGDEVIVPDITWIASVAVITYVGATPIFADIDPQTWCLSRKTVEPLITPKTKAIIAVNLYGHMPEYDDLLSLGIPIIEDAAEAIGSKYKNKLAGTFGITSCFSFHGTKTLSTGEGGMMVTDDQDLYNRCMILRDHGRNPGDIFFQHQQVGFKYKMSNLQAAIGLAQLERIDELVAKKRQIFDMYRAALNQTNSISLNPDHPDIYNSYWMTTVLFDKPKMSKFEMIKVLQAQGVMTRPYFDPLSSLQAFANHPSSAPAKQRNINAYNISLRGLNLPSAASVTENDVADVVERLNSINNTK